MERFNYVSRYGSYEDCWFEISRYVESDNLAIEIWSPLDGAVTRVTVNVDFSLPDDCIAVKDYSENEGMVDWLISQGLVEPNRAYTIKSAWVDIPIMRLTEKGIEVFRSE